MFNGHPFTNETWPYLHDYNVRKTMKKLGYTDNMSNLDADDAEIFYLIDQTIIRLENEKASRKGT